MYQLPKCVWRNIFPREAQSLSQLVQCFGGWIFVCCLVKDNPDGLQGFTSREFASPSPFPIKFANPFDTMSACAPLFSLQGFPTFVGHISSYRCTRNFYFVKLNFFTFLSCRIITHILTAFSITFLAHLKNNGYPPLGFSSEVFTFDHLFT